MKLKSTFAAVLAVSSLSVTGFSQAAGETGSGPNPFSDCGIGAAIFKNDVAAAISNVIWDVGTTAVISATASPETCEGKEADAAAFIMESYDNLIEDSAHGEGEHFATLMNILEVAHADRSAIMSNVRNSIAIQLADKQATRVEQAENYYHRVISAVSELS